MFSPVFGQPGSERPGMGFWLLFQNGYEITYPAPPWVWDGDEICFEETGRGWDKGDPYRTRPVAIPMLGSPLCLYMRPPRFHLPLCPSSPSPASLLPGAHSPLCPCIRPPFSFVNFNQTCVYIYIYIKSKYKRIFLKIN